MAFRADYDAVTCADGCPRHLCGHDGHSAVLAGFCLWLDTVQPEKDVYLIFQPGEENGMGAAMCFACASTGLEIKFFGKQSHAAYPDEPFRWSEARRKKLKYNILKPIASELGLDIRNFDAVESDKNLNH